MNRIFTARMQPARYELDNVWDNMSFPVPPAGARKMGYDFEYHPDGNLRFAGDLLNNKFDRSYGFDHVGRLQTASTAKGARGEPVGPGDEYQMPYSQTFSYDAFGNTTSRDGFLWHVQRSDSATYNNDRRQGWSYDNSGNVVDDATTGTHTYDCANRQAKFISKATVGGFAGFPEEPAVEIEMGYDGDGYSVKRKETRREEVFGQPQPPPTDIETVVTTTYYLRPAVLGQAVISEIRQDGSKQAGYIYADGERLAKQDVQSSSSLTWHHSPGGTGSWIISRPEPPQFWNLGSTRSAIRNEMDPLGADVGTVDPFPIPLPEYNDRDKPLYIEGGDPADLSGGCALDGMPVSCSFVMNLPPALITPPTFGKAPSISWRSMGDFLFSKLPSSGIVNVDPRTPPLAGGIGASSLFPQSGQGVNIPCGEPPWDKAIGENGIINQLLKPLGIRHDWIQNQHVYTVTEGASNINIHANLVNNGWEQYRTDPLPEHFGYDDYRTQYNGEWYHLSLENRNLQQLKEFGKKDGYHWWYNAGQKIDITLHWEEAKPGSLGHGSNWVLANIVAPAVLHGKRLPIGIFRKCPPKEAGK